MNGSWNHALARSGREDVPSPGPAESYKLGVAGVAAEIILWNGDPVAASFYLRLASVSGSERETLGKRLNEAGVRFIPCKVGDHVELLNLDWVSYIRVAGTPPEILQRERLGATRNRAKVLMQSGYQLEGQFLDVMPSARARLSDLLNITADRFLLLVAPAAVLYINRQSIVRVIP